MYSPFYYYNDPDRGNHYTSVKTAPGGDSNEQSTSQVETPRRILRTREAS